MTPTEQIIYDKGKTEMLAVTVPFDLVEAYRRGFKAGQEARSMLKESELRKEAIQSLRDANGEANQQKGTNQKVNDL